MNCSSIRLTAMSEHALLIYLWREASEHQTIPAQRCKSQQRGSRLQLLLKQKLRPPSLILIAAYDMLIGSKIAEESRCS